MQWILQGYLLQLWNAEDVVCNNCEWRNYNCFWTYFS